MRELGAEPKRSLGQNFLISETAISRILLAARGTGLPPPPAIVEIGPGLGSLTEGLLALGPPLVLIELDQTFCVYWRGRLAERDGDRLFEADALRLDWATLALPEGALLVANLPYQISSSLAIERSVAPHGVTRMVLMFQREVGQRLLAKPSTPDYGLLTAVTQAFWDIRLVLEAGPRDFYPPPNVASRVLEFRAKSDPPPIDRARFLKFVKAAFAHRRKLMARNLAQGFLGGTKSEQMAVNLAEMGFSATTTRAEELSPEEFVLLFQALTTP